MPTAGMASTATIPSPALPPPKQIRFVNNEGQPPAKRRRINAACRTCRKRKTRCDGKRPVCSSCTEQGHECLGYADVGEGNQGNTSSSNNNARRTEDGRRNFGDGGEEGDVDVVPEYGIRNGGPRPQSYFDSNPTGPGDSSDGRKSTTAGLGSYRDNIGFSDEDNSPREAPNPILAERHRVPYFRYFGPTAIVPGFKQMVVSVRENRFSAGAGSAVSMSPGSSVVRGGGGSTHGESPSQAGTETRVSIDMPMYDPNDPLPVNRFIIHLLETFFAHLGCNYPFLRQAAFIQKVEEKSVEPILVDAVCALAARFSDHPLLTSSHDESYPKSEYGHVFAQRAKAAVVDTFPCPTVAAVQACLLLAYEGFGASQDSALWMYLGCAIRMAVDLGLQKLDGVKHQGLKDPGYYRSSVLSDPSDPPKAISAQERQEVEQERTDTLWAVFMLDRVISSGTGRPVTLKDEDFELAFPAVTANIKGGWPNPFPALIQITHLYGRVSDLLNNIRDVRDVTPKKIEGLVGMEKDLTQLYQRLDQRLTFNASNFQYYCKSGEGTNFILVHFWFHTLIMLLHQPTLMHSFEGPILQLLPNSRELSMSSAKTIADILSFAELIDIRSFIGNPFTSQPMYIAACAFLMESAAQSSSHPSSQAPSPPRQSSKGIQGQDTRSSARTSDQKQRHSLLASAASQNYQRCYKALQQLETFWAGTRYILVALDQKAKGIWDPETYTEQEYESTKMKRDMIPNWRRKLSLAAPQPSNFENFRSPRMENLPGSSAIDPAQAIGWSLTGTTNSPSSNLTFMYQNMAAGDQAQPAPPPQPAPGNMIYDPIRGSLPESTPATTSTSSYSTRYTAYGQHPRQQSHPMGPPIPRYAPMTTDPATTSEAEMLLGLQNSPYAQTPSSHSYDQAQHMSSPSSVPQDPSASGYAFSQNSTIVGPNSYMGLGAVGDMMMESQEIDITTMGDDMMPWLEYLPQDVLNFFDNGNAGASLTSHVDMGNVGNSSG